MASNSPPILRPTPHRPFEHHDRPSMPPSPLLGANPNDPETPSTSISRSHSILNLTSSTLLGIYSPTGYNTDRDEPATPWGTGAETPASRPPIHRRPSGVPPAESTPTVIFTLAIRTTLLFFMGTLYGLLVRHLHDDRQLAPFQVEGILKPSYDWRYLVFWGVAGVALGSLLPWVDTKWEENTEDTNIATARDNMRLQSGSAVEEDTDSYTGLIGADWTPVVRSVGAFMGIAFAIRKLPWASTLQASLTLAMVNPVLWYLVDRSFTGFILSMGVGATGTAIMLVANPDMLPSPASPSRNATITSSFIGNGVENYVSKETIEGGIWILSVLFCSCVCFGNIGRRLALNKSMEQVAVSRRFSVRRQSRESDPCFGKH